MTDLPDDVASIGWPRAIVTSILIAVVGVVLLVYVPDAILTKVHGMQRGARVGFATAEFAVAFVALAVALRQLQRRNVI